MKTKMIVAAFAAMFAFSVMSCGNKKAAQASEEAATEQCCEGDASKCKKQCGEGAEAGCCKGQAAEGAEAGCCKGQAAEGAEAGCCKGQAAEGAEAAQCEKKCGENK